MSLRYCLVVLLSLGWLELAVRLLTCCEQSQRLTGSVFAVSAEQHEVLEKGFRHLAVWIDSVDIQQLGVGNQDELGYDFECSYFPFYHPSCLSLLWACSRMKTVRSRLLVREFDNARRTYLRQLLSFKTKKPTPPLSRHGTQSFFCSPPPSFSGTCTNPET